MKVDFCYVYFLYDTDLVTIIYETYLFIVVLYFGCVPQRMTFKTITVQLFYVRMIRITLDTLNRVYGKQSRMFRQKNSVVV